MLLTKYEHAHLVLESEGRRLVVDPGSLSPTLVVTEDIDALVVTHEHGDHWTPEHIATIVEKNPRVRIFTTAATAAKILEAVPTLVSAQVSEVADGDSETVGPFALTFHGAHHAVIHSSIPIITNIGFSVNSTLFYGGDSLEVPEGARFDYLAVPIGSPWSNVSEVLDFVLAVPSKHVFTTHDMMLSNDGKNFYNTLVRQTAETMGETFIDIDVSDCVNIGS